MTGDTHKITQLSEVQDLEMVRARFEQKLDCSAGPDGCWLWLGKLNHCGYGTFTLTRGRGQTSTYLAYRVAYMLASGAMPAPGLVVRHTCIGSRACCNPAHLITGTQAENIADRERQGRTADRRGEKGGNSRLTAHQVLTIRSVGSAGRHRSTLAMRYGISPATVSSISNGVRWSHLPMPGQPGWLRVLIEHNLAHLALLKRNIRSTPSPS